MGKTVKLINERATDVYILPEARAKMEMYCELCEKEIGWMGFVEKVGAGYLITDFVLLKQEVHASTTEIDPSALLELWGQTPPEQQGKIKIWGHSHVNMSPTPSSQDNEQMKYFADAGNDWFIRLITNKKGDINLTIYDYANGIEIHDDTLITYHPQRAELREKIKAEIAEKVTEKKYTTAATPASSYNNTYNNKYNSWNSKRTNKGTGTKTEPMFRDIEIKYVNKFEDALNDPNYWQDVLTAAV